MFDQIFHYLPYDEPLTNGGGIPVFIHNDHHTLYSGIDMTKQEFTFELSDHIPLGVQIKVDPDELTCL